MWVLIQIWVVHIQLPLVLRIPFHICMVSSIHDDNNNNESTKQHYILYTHNTLLSQWYPDPDLRKDVTWCASLNYFQLFRAKSNFPCGIKGLINGLDHPITIVQALSSHNIVHLCLTCRDDNTDLTKCTIPVTYVHSSYSTMCLSLYQ